MSGDWTGDFEYKRNSQSELEEVRQQNSILREENMALKESLNQLITINNQLTDSLEEINRGLLQGKNDEQEQLKQTIQQLTYQLHLQQHGTESQEILEAMAKLIQSFHEMQAAYENQIQSLCRELEQEKEETETRMRQYELKYIRNLKDSQDLLKHLKAKEEVLAVLERRANTIEQNLLTKSKRLPFETDTISERKSPKSDLPLYQAQINELKAKERQLGMEISEKNRIISNYGELLARLRRKLTEKF